MTEKSLPRRMGDFVAALGAALTIVYVLLPLLTNSVGVLHRMSVSLEENGIDPSRYYYTDVEQVRESERYLDEALRQ